MSYQVIARKWRSKDFSELVGQDHVSKTLMNALRSGRLPHAILLTGPRGTGKTSSARILAKSLRCPNAKDFIPCNICSECEDINNGRSFDVHELDGASNNGVDAIRELQENVRSMPSTGSHKLYIIDEVHMLSISAFNALLKTLEEPPAHVIFALATTEVQKIPNTILSRCQRFDLRRIPTRLVADHLGTICKGEGVEADPDSLWVIARQGEGSMRDSQSLLDQVITYSDGKITQEQVVEVLGLTDRQLLLDTLQSLCERSPESTLSVVERILSSGHDPSVFTQDLLEEIRHLLLVKMNPTNLAGIVDLPDTEIQRLGEIATDLTEEDVHQLFDMTLKGCADIARAPDPQLVLEMLLLRMAAAPRVHSLQKLLSGVAIDAPAAPAKPASTQKKSIESVKTTISRPQTPPKQVSAPAQQETAPAKPQPNQENKPAAQAASTPASSPTPAPTGGTYDAGLSPSDNWLALVKKLKMANPTMAAQLENTHILEVKDGQVRLSVPDNLQFLFDQLKADKFQGQLKNYLRTFWGGDYTVDIRLGGTVKNSQTPKQAAQEKQRQQDQQVRDKVENHPLVQSVNKEFNTVIDSIKESK